MIRFLKGLILLPIAVVVVGADAGRVEAQAHLLAGLEHRDRLLGHRDRGAENIVNAILDTIADALSQGDRVELRGFGAFSVKRFCSAMRRTSSDLIMVWRLGSIRERGRRRGARPRAGFGFLSAAALGADLLGYGEFASRLRAASDETATLVRGGSRRRAGRDAGSARRCGGPART
jgi:hypothetical protein